MPELTTITSCVECQHLYMPNPVEENYICLRTLEKLEHEIDESIICRDFEEIQAFWIPRYILESRSYE